MRRYRAGKADKGVGRGIGAIGEVRVEETGEVTEEVADKSWAPRGQATRGHKLNATRSIDARARATPCGPQGGTPARAI